MKSTRAVRQHADSAAGYCLSNLLCYSENIVIHLHAFSQQACTHSLTQAERAVRRLQGLQAIKAYYLHISRSGSADGVHQNGLICTHFLPPLSQHHPDTRSIKVICFTHTHTRAHPHSQTHTRVRTHTYAHIYANYHHGAMTLTFPFTWIQIWSIFSKNSSLTSIRTHQVLVLGCADPCRPVKIPG